MCELLKNYVNLIFMYGLVTNAKAFPGLDGFCRRK